MRRLVGNDKVPPEHRRRLRLLKAVRQGLELRTWWWPALEGLSPEDRRSVKRHVADMMLWAASAPRWTVDGRRIS